MDTTPVTGHIHSIQTLGTLDGPGVRFVLFMQGCPLRCGCCHNPDTWDTAGGSAYTPQEIITRAERYREYFGSKGGITVSGGEPLLQGAFVTELFRLAHARKINTCLDTSGCIPADNVKELLAVADRVLLDVKYPTDALYRRYVGCGIETPLAFLSYLNENGIPVTLRQVLIPGLNDTEENAAFLANVIKSHPVIDKTELLPFKKLCTVKYEALGLDFRFKDIPEPSPADVERMYRQIEAYMAAL